MKDKLWCFGDSFTAGDGCKLWENSGDNLQQPNTLKYRKFLNKKDDEIIKLFSDHVAEYFNLELINLGMSGAGNEFILDSLFSNIHLISLSDYIIFGVSYFQRFDISGSDPKKFQTININSLGGYSQNKQIYNGLTKDSLMEILLDRSSQKFEDRLIRQVKGIKHILNKISMGVYVWTNDHYLDTKNTDLFKVVEGYKNLSDFFFHNTISSDTNGEIPDGHLSETGHKILANDIIKYFKNEK